MLVYLYSSALYIFVCSIVFTTVSLSQVVQRRMVSCWAKNKLERICKEPDVANWSGISQIVWWTEETKRKP
jgi:hypothetical protein